MSSTEAFYRGLAQEMAAKLRRVSAFVAHGPSVGAYHEEALRSVLRSMLSSRFAIRTGFAFSEEHGASQQGDILIVDENHPGAYYFREGDFAIVSPEALLCVIEVKTTLNRRTFDEGMNALYSFSRMQPDRAHPVTFLFSYESAPYVATSLSSWYGSVNIPDDKRHYPWAIFSLNRGIILLRQANKTDWGHCQLIGENGVNPKVKQLAVFLQTVRKAMLLYSNFTSNAFSQDVLEGLTWSTSGYRYGSQT